jgi:hypothetical protein
MEFRFSDGVVVARPRDAVRRTAWTTDRLGTPTRIRSSTVNRAGALDAGAKDDRSFDLS